MKPFKPYLLLTKFILLMICIPVVLRAQTNQTVSGGGETEVVKFPVSLCTYQWTNDMPMIGLGIKGTGDIAPFTAINNTNSPIKATIVATPLGYQGQPPLLYVPVTSNNIVSVFNATTNAFITNIPVGTSPRGVAISHDYNKVYIGNFDSNDISVIDMPTNRVIATIPLNSRPEAMAVSPDNLKVYVCEVSSNSIAEIDALTNTVTDRITVGNNPMGLSLDFDGSKMYVCSTDGTISVINTATKTVISTIAIDPDPLYTLLSQDNKTLYVIHRTQHEIEVINTTTGTITTRIIIGSNTQGGMVLSPDGSRLYASNWNDKTVSVINTTTNLIIGTIPVGPGPNGVTISDNGNFLYVSNTGNNTVSVVNTASLTETSKFNLSGLSHSSGYIPSAVCGPVITFNITVNPAPIPAPVINTNGNLQPLTTVYGTPSLTTSFTVSATNLTAGVVITPPAGFELSTNNVAFSPTVTVGSTGTLTSITIYIRLVKTISVKVGGYSGNILLQSPSAEDVIKAMPASTVIPASLTVTADSKNKIYGAVNPPLTVTYSGFVNGEDATQLPTQPIAVTTATQLSRKRQYPITVSGGMATNYTFTYVSGILAISGIPLSPITIPNAFTPNGDGINDLWNIENLDIYPKITVTIFNRYGTQVYFSNGYQIAWDGNYNGGQVPPGTYYYIITGVNTKPLTGYVAVIR